MTFRGQFDHRDQLLAAAIDEFTLKGYDAASINTILATAAMSKGQLYHHFRNKEALYLAIIEWMIDRKFDWLQSHPPQPVEGFMPTLRVQIVAAAEFAAANPDVERFGRSLLAERGRPIFATVRKRFGFDPDGPIGALIEEHHRQGAFNPDVSIDAIKGLVTLVLNNLPDLIDLTEPTDVAKRVDEVLAMLGSGVLRSDRPKLG